MEKVDVYKGRTNVVTVELGFDISADTFASQIRAREEVTSELLMTWGVAFTTDGTDGSLTLTVDNTVTGAITATSGFMDLKRTTGGEPVPVFRAVEVAFRGVVTA